MAGNSGEEGGGDIPDYKFVEPTTQIKTADMIGDWEKSESYLEYLGFILAIGDSVRSRKITESVDMSAGCRRLSSLLAALQQNLASCPPAEMAARYGNPAYRDWYDKLEAAAETLVGDVVGEEIARRGGARELAPYLLDSFGNKTRIDYGTGHEMAFVMFLCALFKVGVLSQEDKVAVGLKIFSSYMELCRELQTVYRMEPAGSMGVWNLDDYQFVSFIWGAAQLSDDRQRFKPKAIADPDMAAMLARDNHLFACLAYIHRVKTGPFHEHSNQLWNISGVARWSKVYTGLVKMYRAEVLTKFPVLQHTRFGSVFTLAAASSPPSEQLRATEPGPSVSAPGPGIDSPRPGAGPRPRLDLPPGLAMQLPRPQLP